MSSGKGGTQQQKIELPKQLKEAAKENLKLAKSVGELPYVPNLGITTAAFTPMQEAGFSGVNNAASAFGLPTSAPMAGMPTAETVGGISGYSTEPIYNDAMSRIDPAILAKFKSFFFPNKGGGQPFGQPTVTLQPNPAPTSRVK